MITNIIEAELLVESLIHRSESRVVNKESRVKPGNSRLFTNRNEVYHVKFTKVPFRPDSDKQGAARELHLKLQFSINTFQNRSSHLLLPTELGTMVGIDEDLILNLCELEATGKDAFIVTVLEREIVLWLPVHEFYNFVMRYDTFMKFPKSGVPVCYVPTGYFLSWAQPIKAFPKLLI